MNKVVREVTQEIIRRSAESRGHYLGRMDAMDKQYPPREALSCGNMAHAYAACSKSDKQTIRLMKNVNIGIVTAYNDMLSAHQPYKDYPDQIKMAARELGSTAQVAGGMPAMCDGVTQGQPGMELSLFSRDVIAMATAISLSHNVFDAVVCLGVCDKIVPGLLIGALEFGHLPTVFIPAGPMPSGLPNKEKAAVRQAFVAGTASTVQLLDAESASYHSSGTCTFYGTANSNQVMLEMLGVQLAGASFVQPEDPLRAAMTREAVFKLINSTDSASQAHRPLSMVVTEYSIVNAIVGLLATGGSTNLSLHLVAIAAAAGIAINWQDFDKLSEVVPLLANVYPNGGADVNAMQAAGGTAFLFNELCQHGLLNEEVCNFHNTASSTAGALESYCLTPQRNGYGRAEWQNICKQSGDTNVLRGVDAPFAQHGGLKMLSGNLGRSVIKISAVAAEHHVIEAECIVLADQNELKAAFDSGELNRDVVVVVRFQGPRANGMPELHKLTPYLSELQDKGFSVALVTDGRMSGASGKVPAAIHLCPEAVAGGPIARLQTGDVIRLDCINNTLEVLIKDDEWENRPVASHQGGEESLGRRLFARLREQAGSADAGVSIFS